MASWKIRRLTMLRAIGGILIGSASASAWSASAGAAPPLNEGLELTIVPNGYDGNREKRLDLSAPGAHFHVVVINRSAHPLRLWRDNVSLGYDNLSFEAVAASGKPTLIRKNKRPWEKNWPAWQAVPPGASLIFDVSFSPPEWVNPLLPGAGRTRNMRIRAVYRIDQGPDTEQYGIWSGTARSDFGEYAVSR